MAMKYYKFGLGLIDLKFGWAQMVAAAIGAYGNYAAAKKNKEAQEAAMAAGTGAVDPWGVETGVGYARPDIEGKGWDLGLTAPWQAEADYFLADAAQNKGWLSQYQEGGPAAAANVLYEQRAAPLRRQQEREQQLFEEQATARGMLQSAPTDRKAALQTEAWGNVYGDVYNKSYMDVQDIIDKYRDRVSGRVSAAGSIYAKPLEYATNLGMPQGGIYSNTAQQGMSGISGAGTAASEGTAGLFSGIGADVAAGKYPINLNRNNKGNNLAAPPGMRQYKPSGTYQSALFRPSAEVNYYGL